MEASITIPKALEFRVLGCLHQGLQEDGGHDAMTCLALSASYLSVSTSEKSASAGLASLLCAGHLVGIAGLLSTGIASLDNSFEGYAGSKTRGLRVRESTTPPGSCTYLSLGGSWPAAVSGSNEDGEPPLHNDNYDVCARSRPNAISKALGFRVLGSLHQGLKGDGAQSGDCGLTCPAHIASCLSLRVPHCFS